MDCMTRLVASRRLWCAVAAVVAAAPAMAQPCGGSWLLSPLQGEPGLNAGAACMTWYDPDGAGPAEPVVAMGGSFDIAGTTYAPGVVLREDGVAAAGARAATRAGGWCRRPNGDLIATGEFNVLAGDAFNYIARLGTGRRGRDMGGGLNAAGTSLAVYGGDVYLGGHFTAAGGQTAYRMARWDGEAWHAAGGRAAAKLGLRDDGL